MLGNILPLRRLAAIMIITAAVTLSSPPAQKSRADIYSRGGSTNCFVHTDVTDKALRNKQYRKAVAGYTKAIEWTEKTCEGKVRPDDLALWGHHERRAKAYLGLGDPVRAAQDIVTMLKAASHRFRGSELDWALSALDAAIARQPKNASLRGGRAMLYGLKKDRVAALAERNVQLAVARTDAERAEALSGRYWVYVTLKERDRALADISKAIDLDPKPDYYERRYRFYLGPKFYFESREPQRALEDISRAIELEPKFYRYGLRAELNEELSQPAAAIDDLSKALALMEPQYTLYYAYLSRRAELYRKTKQLDEAYRDYTELIKAMPKSAKWRARRVLVLLEQGKEDRAKAERGVIVKKLDGKVVQEPAFVCEAAEIRGRRAAEKGKAATPKDLRRAWTLGEIVATVPLQHLINKQNEKIDKAWAAVSQLVRRGQKDAGKEAQGLDAIPNFKGPKRAQVRKAIAFIFRQRKKVEEVLADKVGDQARALFALSTAGHMAYGLNRLGVPNLNRQLGNIIEDQAPASRLPCDVWVDITIKTAAKAKPADVAASWKDAREAFKKFVTKS